MLVELRIVDFGYTGALVANLELELQMKGFKTAIDC